MLVDPFIKIILPCEKLMMLRRCCSHFTCKFVLGIKLQYNWVIPRATVCRWVIDWYWRENDVLNWTQYVQFVLALIIYCQRVNTTTFWVLLEIDYIFKSFECWPLKTTQLSCYSSIGNEWSYISIKFTFKYWRI